MRTQERSTRMLGRRPLLLGRRRRMRHHRGHRTGPAVPPGGGGAGLARAQRRRSFVPPGSPRQRHRQPYDTVRPAGRHADTCMSTSRCWLSSGQFPWCATRTTRERFGRTTASRCSTPPPTRTARQAVHAGTPHGCGPVRRRHRGINLYSARGRAADHLLEPALAELADDRHPGRNAGASGGPGSRNRSRGCRGRRTHPGPPATACAATSTSISGMIKGRTWAGMEFSVADGSTVHYERV